MGVPADLAGHRERLLRTARLLCRDGAAAEELVQETFCRAWSQKRSFRGDSTLYTWLFGIFRHLFLDALRRSLRQRGLRVGFEPQGGVVEGPESLLEACSDQERLRRVLGGLAYPHRQILVLRFAEGLPMRAIAEQLDLPLGTVKSRLHHALGRLRAAWLQEEKGRKT